MRILHLDAGQSMGGGQWQVLRLLRGLRQRGLEAILMADPSGPLGQMAGAEDFVVQPMAWRFPACDLIHVHDAHSHTRAAMFARTPVLVSRRVAFPVKTGLLSRWKYRRATHYLAVSRYVAGMLTAAGVTNNQITVVHDGVPLLPLSTRDGDVIRIAKNASNLEADLLHARLLVYLTEAEGLGSGALLGMSAGVPVIASRTGGLPEVIDDGVNGILTSNEPGEVARCIQRVESDPAEAARLGANARHTVEERFTVERMVEETIAVYRRLLNA